MMLSMYNLPNHTKLNTAKLAAVFNNTTASYKYFWFLSILQIYSYKRQKRVSFEDIVYHMIANAWYIVHYFHLNFGKADVLHDTIVRLASSYEIPINLDINSLVSTLKQKLSDKDKKKLWTERTKYVAPLFLKPWFNKMSEKEIIINSTTYLNDCLYSIEKEKNASYININPKWEEYLWQNAKILEDFCYWNLCLFLQNHNPNVPNIANKMIKPLSRNNLNKQKKFWNIYIEQCGSIECIYTHNKITATTNYDLDHFIPWSFVAHDLNWNLIPADVSINKQKSNNLPNLDVYLKPLATLQHQALQVVYETNPQNIVLEDYRSLELNLDKILRMNNSDFYALYYKNMLPLFQIAQNQGFNIWHQT